MWVGHKEPSKSERKFIKSNGSLSGTHSDSYFRGKTGCSGTIVDQLIDSTESAVSKNGASCIITNLHNKIAAKFIKIDGIEEVICVDKAGDPVLISTRSAEA